MTLYDVVVVPGQPDTIQPVEHLRVGILLHDHVCDGDLHCPSINPDAPPHPHERPEAHGVDALRSGLRREDDVEGRRRRRRGREGAASVRTGKKEKKRKVKKRETEGKRTGPPHWAPAPPAPRTPAPPAPRTPA
uniref:Uncharacterized protein n=1 Tax=Ananas comosus var. bracteatus TaxID=296719 RepID=A0A6V7PV76_ANACO|nr:unnamed protein product [Ananas comosus var. bracteatus]